MKTSFVSSLRLRQPPALGLFAALAYCLMAIALAIGMALRMPWLGLQLAAGPDGSVVVVHSQIPAVPTGARLQSVATPGQAPVALVAQDLVEEPDILDSFAHMDAFFARQSQLAAVLQGPQVVLQWLPQAAAPGAVPHATIAAPRKRPMSGLPLLFWFQIAVSVTGCMIACWVWVLRPHDWGARMFGITGLAFPLFAMPAAIYSGRELALPGEVFWALSHLNHLGAALFGAALVAIFMVHPRFLRPGMRPAWLAAPFALWGLWWWADVQRLVPGPDEGIRALSMTAMLLAIAFAAVQWRRSKGDALGRACLRWLSLSLLVGSGLFIMLVVTTVVLGWLPPLPQGYAFGFFLFIYVGIALGLRRYRLFDLDEWAWRMLLWVGGAVAVIGVDALLITLLDWSASTALGASLWICGALYFPTRQWLWQSLARRPAMRVHELIPDVVRIAIQPSRPIQKALWDDLLRRIYDPLHLQDSDLQGTHARLNDSSLTLHVPACGGMAARCLRYPSRGQRLFSSKDATFMDALCQLMDQAQAGRSAYERGASEERRRIARDMHDDVGARLLMLIHRAGSPDLADLARAAMHDLRTALHVMDAHDIPLADAFADWRAEASARCEAAHAQLAWSVQLPGDARLQLPPLGSRQKAVIERALREGLTNALRHARPQRVEVSICLLPSGALQLVVRNDGAVGEPGRWGHGRGLRGMHQRLQQWGGWLQMNRTAQGMAELIVHLPLNTMATTSAA